MSRAKFIWHERRGAARAAAQASAGMAQRARRSGTWPHTTSQTTPKPKKSAA